MSQKNHKLDIRHLAKSFGQNHVLRDVSFSIDKAESLVIIGGSGTGKSVAIKCILNLLSPDKGQLFFNGEDLLKMSKSAHEDAMKKFGMLFQGAALFDSLSIWENVAFGLLNGTNIKKAAARDIAIARLQDVGLSEDIAFSYPAELSGGMKKRVGLARAIATDPEVIFFDEPTTGLDPIMCSVIDTLIIKCVRKLGATALTITHDMASVRRIADKVAMLHDGKIIWHGAVKEMDTTDNPYVKQFIHGDLKGPITNK